MYVLTAESRKKNGESWQLADATPLLPLLLLLLLLRLSSANRGCSEIPTPVAALRLHPCPIR